MLEINYNLFHETKSLLPIPSLPAYCQALDYAVHAACILFTGLKRPNNYFFIKILKNKN